MKYEPLTPEVEAVQWTGDNIEEVLAFTDAVVNAPVDAGLFIALGPERFITDWRPVPVGAYIVRRPGEDQHFWPHHWPMDQRTFDELYSEVPA